MMYMKKYAVNQQIHGTILGERWQYSVVPLNPVKSTSTDWSSYDKYPYYGMGVYGYATSGGTFFDTRSSPTGDTAWNNEIDTLDTCMGHSNEALQYHYHGVSCVLRYFLFVLSCNNSSLASLKILREINKLLQIYTAGSVLYS